MGKTVNKHGVHLKDITSVHKSVTKKNRIPFDDITKEQLATWKRVDEETRRNSPLGTISSSLVPIDVTYSGMWLGEKLRELGVDEERISTINFNLGRRALLKRNEIWADAQSVVEMVKTSGTSE